MRILSLELTDFGPHRHRLDQMNASVVGLLGPNGSGKTNLLQAIKFAFTGELTDNLESYIRGRGVDALEGAAGPDAAKKAEVSLRFMHHGQEGLIIRRITPTSTTRKFLWDGEELTQAAEVDSALADILGADKKALAEIVFPPQGELHKMLFGKQADREEMFLRLLLLTHFGKVSDLADAKARLLKYEVSDLTAQKEQLRTLIEQQTELLNEAESDLSRTSSWSNEITLWGEAREVSAQLATVTNQLSTMTGRLPDLQQQLMDAMGRLPNRMLIGADPLDIAKEVEYCRQLEKTLTGIRDAQLQAFQNETKRREMLINLEAANQAAKELVDELASLDTADAASAQQGWTAQAVADALTFWRELRLKQREEEALQSQVATLTERLSAAQAAHTKAASVVERGQAAVQLRELLSKKELKLNVLSECTRAHSGLTSCPVCDSKLTQKIDQETVTALKQEVAQFQRQLADTLTEEATRVQALQRAETEVGTVKTMLDNTASDLQTLSASIRSYTPPALTEEVLVHTQNQYAGRAERRRQIQHGRLLESAQRKVYDLSNSLSTLPQDGQYDQAKLDECNQSIQALQPHLSLAQDVLDQHNRLTSQYREIETQLANLETRKTQLEQQRRDLWDRFPDRLKELVRREPQEQVAGQLQAWDEMYRSKLGSVQQAKRHLELTQGKLNDLLSREEADKLRKRLAEDMVLVKEAFSRRGLPLTYIQYRYQQLVELANRNLSVLDATFSVETDPKQAVSLNFRRTDDTSDTLFSMNKLSGGQRVRLSIAFLLAVQQLVIPELGLLVLDEPSTHVNDEGVESLADLLQNLGQQLAAEDAQIVVCDHNHRLERAFQTTIRLG